MSKTRWARWELGTGKAQLAADVPEALYTSSICMDILLCINVFCVINCTFAMHQPSCSARTLSFTEKLTLVVNGSWRLRLSNSSIFLSR